MKKDKSLLKKELYELIKTDERIFDFTQKSTLEKIWYWDLENPENDWKNTKFLEILGYSLDETSYNKNIWGNIINQDDLKIAIETFHKFYQNPKSTYEQKVRYLHKKGHTVWIHCRGITVDDKNGRPTKILGIYQKISEAKDKELEIEKSKTFLQSLLTSIDNYILRISPDLIIQFINRTYPGVTIEQVIGTPILDWIQAEHKELYRSVLMKTLETGQAQELKTQGTGQDNQPTWYLSRFGAIKEAGKIVGVIVIGQDITELKMAELEIIKAKEKAESIATELEESQKVARLASWYLDVATNQVTWSEELYKMFGFDTSQSPPPYNEQMNIFTPESWEILSRELEKTKQTGIAYELELNFIRKDKSNGWMWVRGKAVFNIYKEVVGLRGVAQDITDRKLAEDNLTRQSQIQQILIQLASSFINVPLSEVPKSIEKALANLGNFFNVDRAYIFDYDWEKNIINNTYEWCNVGISPEIDNLQEVSSDLIPQWVKTHKKGEKLIIPDTSADSVAQELKDLLIPQGIKSLITVPMMMGKECIGFIGFDSVREYRAYSESEEEILFVLSQMLVNITERKRAEEELINSEAKLIKAKEKAEESDRLKTEFIHNMSHEIRTPMNGILGFANILNEQDLSPEKRKHYTSIIQNSGNQLLRIIDDILEISKLETKQVKVVEKEICLNDLLLEHFSVFDIKAKENKIPLYFKKGLSDRKSTILTDSSKLKKVLSNLLENAVKYTQEGFIEFGYQQIDEFLELYVKDTGIGVKESMYEKIFDRFSQEEKDLSRNVGGLGLGLSIAKENAELLGGTIRVESKKGQGSTFFVKIPYKQVYVDTTKDASNNSNTYTVLIAEDEEINYFLLEVLLGKEPDFDIQIIHAKNGQEAVGFCQENTKISLVLMDIKMPIMNGYEATKKIKELYPDLPVIIQTAHITSEAKKEAFMFGCDDFILKPIRKNTLSEILHKYLGKNEI